MQVKQSMTRDEFDNLDVVSMLRLVGDEIVKVNNPYTLFGDEADAKSNFRSLIKRFSVDQFINTPTKEDDDLAGAVMSRILELWDTAKSQMENGTYGENTDSNDMDNNTPSSSITVRGVTYDVYGTIRNSSVGVYYYATANGLNYVFHVARDPQFNDLLANEADVLNRIRENRLANGVVDDGRWEASQAEHYIPQFVTSFSYEGRQANILTYADYLPAPTRMRTISEVKSHFNDNIDPRHGGWFWTHIIPAMDIAHSMGYVHGNITPDSVWVSTHPEFHEILLMDWTHAVIGQKQMNSGSSRWQDFYHPEIVVDGHPVHPNHDTYMAAKTMQYGFPQMETDPALFPMKNYFDHIAISYSGGIIKDSAALHSNWRLALHDQMQWERGFVPMYFDHDATIVEWEWFW